MAKVTYTVLDREYNSIPENESYSSNDINLIDNYQINKEFRVDRHYIESHFYSLNNSKLFSLYDYDLTTNVEVDGDGKVTNLNLNPEELSIENGFTGVDHKIVHHFLNDLYSLTDGKQAFFINSISQDRREILLYSDEVDVNTLITKTEELKEKITSQTYFEEYWLNLGENDLFIVTNIDVYELDDKYTIALRLYEPLPKAFELKHQVQLVEKVSDSIVIEVQVEVEEDVESLPTLRGPNYNIELDVNTPTPTEYFNYDELFSYSNGNSNREIYSHIKDNSVEINIDYSDYSNFVHFSSAQERLKNFKYKVELLETYDSSKTQILNSSNNSGSISHFDKLINGVIENFDHYEKDLYFNSGSHRWPKSTTAKPHTNLQSTSTEVNTWYTNQLNSASNYDTSNYDVLTNTLPSYIAEDTNNNSAILFVSMIGQHFDNLWVYTKAITDKYDNDNRVDVGISKDLVREVLASFGTKLYNSKEGANDLFKYLVADTYDSGSTEEVVNTFVQVPNIPADSQPISRKYYEGELYKRIYHNLPLLLKSKGTERGLRALINCFGIPSEYLTVKQYGGDDIQGSKFFGYETDKNSTDKVRVETRASGSVGKVLIREKSIQKTETIRTQDIHRVEVGFSPSDSINNYIIGQVASSFNIDDYIGDPRELHSDSYADANKRAYSLLQGLKRFELNDFVRILKFYDNVLFKMIKDFVPAKSTLDSGIIIKPHLLNRSKAKSPKATGTRPEYSASIDILDTIGTDGGAYETTPELNPYSKILEHKWIGELGGISNFSFKPDNTGYQVDPGEIAVIGTKFFHKDGTEYTFLDKPYTVYTPYEGATSTDLNFYLMFSSESVEERFNMDNDGWGLASFNNKHPHLIAIDYSPHGQNSWVARDNSAAISASFTPLPSDTIIAAFTLEATTDILSSFNNYTKPLNTLPSSYNTTIYKDVIRTKSGSVNKWVEDESPKINGELSGSYIEITDGELNRDNNFKQVNVPALNYDIIKVDEGSNTTLTSFILDKDTPASTSTASCAIGALMNDTLYHNDTGSFPATVGTYIFTDIAGANTFIGSTNDRWYRINNQTTILISGSLGGNPGYVGKIVPCSDFDTTAPSGYRAIWNQKSINNSNYTAAGFSIFGGNPGETYQVTASLQDDPSEVAYGTGTISATSQSATINTTNIADGENVILDVKLVDSAGNVGTSATVHDPPGIQTLNSLTASFKDIVTPSGYTVDFKTNSNYNTSATSYSNANFYIQVANIANGEKGTLSLNLSSTGGFNTYNTTRQIDNTLNNNSTSNFLLTSFLHNMQGGTLTVTVRLTDEAGNQGPAVTDSIVFNNVNGILDHANYLDNMVISRFYQTVQLRVRNITGGTSAWTLEKSGESFVTLGQTSGNGADNNVPVTFSSNYNTYARWAQLYLKINGVAVDSFSIQQNGTSSGSSCIAPFTHILMSDGALKQALHVAVGDEVKTKHERTLEDVNARIYSKKVINSDRIKVILGDKEIVCSPKHRFYVDSRSEYVHADELRDGDILSGENYIRTEEYESGDVVELSVEYAQTYISNGILSHNNKGFY